MKENILKEKTLLFAIRVVNLYRFLTTEHKEYVLSKQVLRSGTSVGAMIREAEFGQSKSDFIHKLSIAQKEINETIYWLELLQKTDYIPYDSYESINLDAIEIIKLITSSIKTAKSKD
ncbi:MAG: four helix bundle protein [Flavobacterium macrobrachii]